MKVSTVDMYRHCWSNLKILSFTFLGNSTQSKIWVFDSELYWQLPSHFIAYCCPLTMVHVTNIRLCVSYEVIQLLSDVLTQDSKIWCAMFTSFNSENNLSTTGVCITHSTHSISRCHLLYRNGLIRVMPRRTAVMCAILYCLSVQWFTGCLYKINCAQFG